MENLSKIAVAGSLVLGTVLFSIGCGGDSFCCKDGEPPIPKIADAGTASANYSNGQYTLTDSKVLKLNGINDSVDTDNGRVVKCNWYIADEGKDGEAVKKERVVKDKCENVEIDFSKYAPNTKKLVCLEVIDNNGLSSNLNNGFIPDFNSAGKIREGAKNDKGLEGRKKLDCRRVVISGGSVVNPAKPDFSIYNTRTDQLTSATPVKQNCPFYFKPTNTFTQDTTCEWTIDGVKVSEDCKGVFDQRKDDLNSHEICLVTNGDVAGKVCHNFQSIEHTAPTPVMKFYDANKNEITGNLTKQTNFYLSCKDSKNDCPGDNSRLECEWDASSYAPVNGSCEVPANERSYIYEHCFTNDAHTAHGPDKTKAYNETLTNLDTLTYQYVCGSAADKCVEVKLRVRDEKYNKTSDWTSKIFKVNP